MKKYKIVVLSNLDSSAHTTLKSTVSLSKIINGEIEVFSVKKATEIVDRENQLSAIRTINSQRTILKKKMQNLIAPLSLDYGAEIKYSIALGNVKNEIEDFIKERQPDIIVMTKRKGKFLNLMGDRVIQFVLNFFKGTIMIVADKNALELNEKLSLGMLNHSESTLNLEFTNELIAHTQSPLRSFNIIKNSNLLKEVSKPSNKKTIEYVFENKVGTMKSLSNYIAKNNIDLLYVDRAEKSTQNTMNFFKSNINEMANKLNVTLLLTAKQNTISKN